MRSVATPVVMAHKERESDPADFARRMHLGILKQERGGAKVRKADPRSGTRRLGISLNPRPVADAIGTGHPGEGGLPTMNLPKNLST